MVRVVLTIGAVLTYADAAAQDAPRPYDAVVCTSEANGPWTQKARGTLTRTRSGADLAYKFEGDGQSFDWRFVTSPQGNTTVSDPGSLMERFGVTPKTGEASAEPERRQSVEASGEIHEAAGPNRLALLIGTKCPQAKPPRRM